MITDRNMEKIKAAVTKLDEAVKSWRDEPEGGHAWSWDDENVGSHLADAAEVLILALPPALWPDSWFQAKSATQPGDRPVSRYEERLVDELLDLLGL
ncbi:hypothetical protein ACH427_21115 [Streptomyces sp. NPDC020379]|uniref:hypothetical protein n=1 Tax=Streptomyces sp. NPDC020379 TaxID=3365071 RepID=UPI0037B0DF4C